MTSRKATIVIALLVSGVLSASIPLRAQVQKDLQERLRKADDQTLLEDSQLKPWHMLLTVQLFKGGNPSEKGEIEEWWSGPSLRKIAYRFPSYTSTELENANGFYRTLRTEPAPERLSRLRDAAVRPGWSKALDISHSQTVLNKQDFGSTQLDCIMTAPEGKDLAHTTFGTYDTFCFTSDSTSLRAMYSIESMLIARNKLGKFQDKIVAIDLDSTAAVTKVHDAAAHVENLATFTDQGELFVPGPDMQKVAPAPVFVSDSIMRDYLVHPVAPIYPEEAKRAHIAGTVRMRLVIGEDGKVQSVKELESSSAMLTGAAIEAAKQRVYRPYVLRGRPVAVSTTTVSFFHFGAQ